MHACIPPDVNVGAEEHGVEDGSDDEGQGVEHGRVDGPTPADGP